jgi:hypothetical protein
MSSPSEIQFEKYWRDKISQEIALYTLQNMDRIGVETYEALDHVRENVKRIKR